METVEARAEQAAEEQTTEEREQQVEELRQQLTEAQQAEQRLIEEQAELEEKQKSILDSDDPAMLEAALSGKKLGKGSRYRANLDRLAELPGMVYALRRRVLVLSAAIAELELLGLEEERRERSRLAREAQERHQQAQHELAMAQSMAAGAAGDRDEKRRQLNRLRNQLAKHEQSKPNPDRFEAQLSARKVWRG